MWQETNNQLVKEFEFKDFNEAISFMNKAAVIINELDHHPEWTNVYNKVIIKLSTHDAGNVITEKDRELARRLDKII